MAEADRLERIISQLIELVREIVTDGEVEGIDAVIAGFDAAREENDE